MTGISGEHKIEDIVKKRYSCRSYRNIPLSDSDRASLERYISKPVTGPFGGSARFVLFTAESGDTEALKGLGTYGVIKNPAAFVAGVIKKKEMNLEDFGYAMERIILHATDLGLGTCWLGGTFAKSGFASKAGTSGDELIPSVVSIGYPSDKKSLTGAILSATAGSAKRKNHDELFFSSGTNRIDVNYEDGYGRALEMVRLAPSASNKQPWRVVKEEGRNKFHFYLERSVMYGIGMKILGYADLQRIDMGIALCHFESAALEYGLKGKWKREALVRSEITSGREYIITWDGE